MDFSVTEASLAGFRVIGRRPLSALVWAVVWIVFGYGGLGLLLYWSGPQLAAAAHNVSLAGVDPQAAMAAVFQFELGFVRVLWPWALWAWLISVVLRAATYRAVLEPRRRGFAYLRLGGDELRLVLLAVIYWVLTVIYFLAIGLACGAAFWAASRLAQPWLGLADTAVVLVAICLSVFIGVRLLLAAPMTFARKRLQIFDSWRVTRGRFWPLLGVIVLAVIFALAIGLAIGLIRNALLIGSMQSVMREAMQHPTEPGYMMSRFAQMLTPQVLSPALAAFVVIQGLADIFLRVVVVAPFAESYRVLAAPPPPPPAAVLEPEPAQAAPDAFAFGHDGGHDAHDHGASSLDAHDHAAAAEAEDHGHSGDDGHGEEHGQSDGHGDDHGHDDGHSH